jgi:drug/metabolite transporter (DMT)-like permease
MFLISMQMAVGAVIIGLAGILTGDLGENLVLLKQERASWTLIGVSVSAFVVGNYLIAVSINGGSAVTAGLVEISYPLFIALFSVVLLGTGQLTFGTVIGGALILAGALVLKLNH